MADCEIEDWSTQWKRSVPTLIHVEKSDRNRHHFRKTTQAKAVAIQLDNTLDDRSDTQNCRFSQIHLKIRLFIIQIFIKAYLPSLPDVFVTFSYAVRPVGVTVSARIQNLGMESNLPRTSSAPVILPPAGTKSFLKSCAFTTASSISHWETHHSTNIAWLDQAKLPEIRRLHLAGLFLSVLILLGY